MRKFVAVLMLVVLTGCVDTGSGPKSAKTTLENLGYTQVQMQGYGWLRCSDDDLFQTRFTAVGSSGKSISGTVCEGLFKGKTVRLD